MRGRRAQPETVREKKAPVRSRRTKPAAPTTEAHVPESRLKAPSWLKGEGLKIWDRRAPMLRAAKLLSSADELVFARYCRNFAAWLKLRAVLDRKGYTYESESNHGKLRRADPNFLIADRLERQLLAVEDRFGMNPAERQRIMVQRAAGGGAARDLVDRMSDEADPAATPSKPAEPIEGPIGLLN